MSFMKFVSILILLQIVLLKSVRLECSNSNQKKFKTYIIDLDKPAKERFYQPSYDYRDEIALLIESRK